MTTFAFAGVYLRTLVLPALLCTTLLVAYRPLDGLRVHLPWIAFLVVQLVPLPAAIVDVLSPHARDVNRAIAFAVPAALPLSVDVDGGVWAVLVAGCALVTFLTARHVFARGGVRRVIRAVAAIGLVLSAVALAQEATGGGLMYWRWRPIEEGAEPFGPFVNRNHFGTWVVLAVPLVLGYLAARAAAYQLMWGSAPHPGSVARGDPHAPLRSLAGSSATVRWPSRMRAYADARTIWLIAAVMFMLVALAATLSRSAMFGLAVAVAVAPWFRPADGRVTAGHSFRWVAAGVLLTVAAVLVRVDPAALGARLAAAPVSIAGRLVIWRDTVPLLRDFWLTGTGAGTYETVMLVYQRSALEVRFNQAHNHYLQLAAEGGLILVVALAIAGRAVVRDAAMALKGDASGMYFVRAGACCGLAGAAAQSLWETGLTTPANALLAAVLAAIAVHVPVRADRQGDA